MTPIIELKDVHKSFSDKEVLRGVDLSIEPGERIAIIGPSGCGKSTLLRIIMGFVIPTSGEVWVLGKNLATLSAMELAQIRLNFGMMFQSGALFDSMTVYDNVAFSLRENLKMDEDQIDRIVKENLALVEMADTEQQMPADLSGGMRKRIALARAISTHPKVVLYDEPTAGLDPVLTENIEGLMVKLNHQFKVTSVVVTHNISTILNTGEKIYFMKNGKLLAPESPQTILNSSVPEIKKFMRGGQM